MGFNGNSPELLERDEPIAELERLLLAALAGEGRIGIVGGEAGIGKTSVLFQIRRRAAERMDVAWGSCEALFTPRALGPLYDMAPSLGSPLVAIVAGSASQERIFSGVLDLLQNSPRPRLLVIEDLHWADHATLDLIKYIGRRIAFLPVALLLTLRSDEVEASSPIAQMLGDLPAALTRRITLKPLSLAAVTQLASRSGYEPAELLRITAGNPFFLTEVVANRNPIAGRVPDSVRDAVTARIGRLPAAHRDLLGLISTQTGSAEPWLLRAALGDDVDATIEDCMARELIVRDAAGALKFRHELARRAVFDQIATGTRKALHGRIERALSARAEEGFDISIARRVHHAAGAADADRVLALAPLAAAEAARLGAHVQAAAHYRSAIDYVSHAPKAEAARLYESWAYEAGLAVGIDETVIAARRTAIELWRALGRQDKVAHNLRWLSRLHWYRGESELARGFLDQAIGMLDNLAPSPELAMCYSMRSQFHMLRDETDAAIDWGRRALALAEQLGEMETRIHALNNIASAMLLAGLTGGGALMEESLSLALAHGFHEQAARAYTNYADYAVSFKEFALAERLFAEGIAFDTRHDLDSWTHYLIGRQAHMKVDQGRFEEAEAIARGILSIDRLTLIMRLPARIVLAKSALRLGRPDSQALLHTALEEALATDEQQYIAPVRLARVESAWLDGDAAKATAELNALAKLNLAGFDPWERGELAVWWTRCGHPAPYPGQLDAIAPPRAAELAGDFAGAAAQWRERDHPYERALCLLHTTGPEAGAAIGEACGLLERLGAGPAVAWARRHAKHLGLASALPKQRRGPYAAARAHPLGLTAKEVQVLGLIAKGLSNQAIAQKLNRSERTVEHHVSAVLAKLNARTRMDVLLRLHSEPWLLPDTA